MPANLTSLATRHAGRPLLLTPRAALELANRVRAVDPGAVAKPSRLSALFRKLGAEGRRAPMAMEDDDYVPEPMESRLAYSPLYAGEPDDLGFCWALKDGVAMMQIDKPLLDRGEIFCGEVYHGYDTILQGLRDAHADDRVRAIFIREATPGGVVAGGLPALAEFMRENGQRGGGKPIHVYADMACSAGYWIASSADKIIAPRVGLIGSIGAVIVHENWSGALKEAGIEITPIQFGEAKTDGAWWDALSPRARADLQAEIDQCGRDFVADVVAGRPQLSPEEVIATQAAVFMGHHDEDARSALSLKLVDAIASEEAAFIELRDQVAGSSSTIPATGPITAEAPRGSGSASPAPKEAPVARRPKAGAKASGKSPLAAAKAALRTAKANVARLTADAASAEAEDEDEGADGALDADAADPADAAAPDEEDGDEADDDDDEDDEEDDAVEPKAAHATAIAASAEASSHPKLALAAISNGLTLSQFKATAAASGPQASGGRLGRQMAGARRLGPDGAKPEAQGSALSRRAEQRRKASDT